MKNYVRNLMLSLKLKLIETVNVELLNSVRY